MLASEEANIHNTAKKS